MASLPTLISTIMKGNLNRAGPGSSTMERFPPEILVMIKDMISDVDALNLRIVCKTVYIRLTPFIFSTVEASYLPTSFRNLLNICSSPSLNKYVTKLCYYAEIYGESTREDWQTQIRFPFATKELPAYPEIPEASEITAESLQKHIADVQSWAEKCTPVKFYTEAELQAGFQIYSNQVQAQQSFSTDYSDFTSLAEAMTYLENLTTITAMINPFVNCQGSQKLSRSTDLVGPSGDWWATEPEVGITIRQVTCLLLAIFSALPKLKSLKIQQIPWSVIGGQFGRGIKVGAFVHLEKLTLDISHVSDQYISGNVDYDKRQNLLGKAMQSAKGLKFLKLGFWCHGLGSDNNGEGEERTRLAPIRWSTIFGNSRFPMLRALDVCGIDIDPSWLDFFSENPLLRSVTIKEAFLLDRKSWVSIFTQLKGKTPVQMEKLTLVGRFWWNFADTARSQIQSLDMDGGLVQLTGPWDTEDRDHPGRSYTSKPSNDKLSLGDHIENWILKNGPSPFEKTG